MGNAGSSSSNYDTDDELVRSWNGIQLDKYSPAQRARLYEQHANRKKLELDKEFIKNLKLGYKEKEQWQPDWERVVTTYDRAIKQYLKDGDQDNANRLRKINEDFFNYYRFKGRLMENGTIDQDISAWANPPPWIKNIHEIMKKMRGGKIIRQYSRKSKSKFKSKSKLKSKK